MGTPFTVKPADKSHLDALVALENTCFESDRLTRRNFQWMLSKAKASLLVAESADRRLLGYILVLFHRGTSLARIYSIAVAPESRGLGLGLALMTAAETEARKHNCIYMRLEVRKDNASAIELYKRLGYREFETWRHYYEDDSDALRFEKRIEVESPSTRINVPFYPQSTEFTCGPAALLMAMTANDPDYRIPAHEELQLWREATTIFMTSGHGGCGPRGLALAALARGFQAEIYLSQEGPLFLQGVRSEAKKNILLRVHEDFKARAEEAKIPIHRNLLTTDALRKLIRRGSVPLMLISSYRLYGEKSPHWIVITGISDRFVFFNDPSVDHEAHETNTDHINVPIRLDDFTKMAQFGRSQLKAAVILSRRKNRTDPPPSTRTARGR